MPFSAVFSGKVSGSSSGLAVVILDIAILDAFFKSYTPEIGLRLAVVILRAAILDASQGFRDIISCPDLFMEG